jgi:hypothetical protein
VSDTGRSDPLVTHAKMLRLEVLKVKADLDELGTLSLNRSACRQLDAQTSDSMYVRGIGLIGRRVARPAV